VVPVYNEQEVLESFYHELIEALDSIDLPFEVIFVDDCSDDDSFALLESLHRNDSRVRVISFSRNFGQMAAISAGLEHASGAAVVIMDADLQHPPSMIAQMVKYWQEGYQVVYTVRSYDPSTPWFKRASSALFYQLINKISEIQIIPGAADFRLIDRQVVDYLNTMPENSRFLRGMISWLGFRQIGIPFQANARVAGESKYSFWRMVRLAMEGFTSFSTLPLKWSTYLGLFSALSGLPYGLFAIYQVIFTNQTVPGWASIIVAILFLGGVQLMSLGVIGEYIGRIYTEVKRRPLYVLEERIGFEEGQKQKSDDSHFQKTRPFPPPHRKTA
jgi:glycosyltransferase involved in cell wall biosynthesis